MKTSFLVKAALLLALFSLPQRATAEFAVGLGTGNQLITFDTMSPGVTTSPVTVTGLMPGTSLVGIDFRPSTPDLLFGVGQAGGVGTVYQIDFRTGIATSINTGFTLTGAAFGVDFNPAANALRIVSNTGQNLRLPMGGVGAAITDGMLNPGMPSVVGSAYTNNFAGTTSTTLFAIDSVANALFIQTPPNDGTLVPVGPLGIDVTNALGFDISGFTGTAYAALNVPTTGTAATGLYNINLTTGAASFIGGIGGGLTLTGLAVQTAPEPGSLALLGLGAAGLLGYAWRRRKLAAQVA